MRPYTYITLLVCATTLACAKSTPPPEAPAASVVSEEETWEEDPPQEPTTPQYDQEFAVTSPDAARELAEAAVADRLNLKQTWKTSPVLPTAWPPTDKQVMFLFFPMAASPNSMSHFQAFSAAYRVDVGLEDGATRVKAFSKPRKLGTVEDSRASMLERRELETAQAVFVHELLVGSVPGDPANYWGYLKYFHEHPAFAKDIASRAPKFVRWLNETK